MARKRGEYQKRKERQDKISTIIVALFFFVGTALMLYGLVQAAVNVYDIDHNTLNTYTGEYQYRLKMRYGRRGRSSYIFTLDNGDVVLISEREIDHEELLGDNNILTFQYTTMYSNPLYGRYSAVSVTSADGDVEFVNVNRSRKESVLAIWTTTILSILTISICSFYILCVSSVYNWKKRYQNWHKKMRKRAEQAKLPQEE